MTKALKVPVRTEFGWLTVLRDYKASKRGRLWWCRCRCGKEMALLGWVLRMGDRTSCGCRRGTLHIKHGHNRVTHFGMASPEYRTWNAMIQRCHNPKSINYKNYGARGICVCPRWRKSFPDFLRDMGLKLNPKLTIERKNNDLGYEPGNCKWATRREQLQNRRPMSVEGHRSMCLAARKRYQSGKILTHEIQVMGGRAAMRLRTPEQQRQYGKIGGKIGGPFGAHTRWHLQRGIINPNCDLCMKVVVP
jgi:hypothetical protein